MTTLSLHGRRNAVARDALPHTPDACNTQHLAHLALSVAIARVDDTCRHVASSSFEDDLCR